MRKLTILLSCLVFVCCSSFDSSSIAASPEEEILEVAENFAKAFSTSDYELMSSIHWHSPQLTKFAPDKGGAFLVQGWETIGKDWKTTFEAPAGAYTMSNHNPQVTMLSDSIAITTLYQITTMNPPVVTEQVIEQHRQTLVVQKIKGKWLIVHEHVSMLPTE